MTKYNTEIFIKKAIERHDNKYDYNLDKYLNATSPVKIICIKHGIFEQTPVGHLRGRGCPLCAGKNKTTEQFIDEANIVHNNKYTYFKVIYINATTPITITCPIHGDFEQKPSSHLSGFGCKICGGNINLTTEKFIEKANLIHGHRYDYSKVIYKNSHKKVIITCPIHGDFEQKPNNHLNGANCPKCIKILHLLQRTFTTNKFIDMARKIHNNKYDYSKVNNIKSTERINILCPKHGLFIQSADSHLRGHGCPSCNESKGELRIKQILKRKNIIFIFQKTFDDCRNLNNRKLKFDFYLPKQNILIEYDGKQHYEPIEYFGGVNSYNKLKEYDIIKTNFTKTKNIKLIRISYQNYNNIEKILLSI
jgi:hypothetical protein